MESQKAAYNLGKVKEYEAFIQKLPKEGPVYEHAVAGLNHYQQELERMKTTPSSMSGLFK